MSEDNRIKQNQVPYQEFKQDKSEDVDPEKFKKIMKVGHSEDSQKKKKKPLKEEEGEDDDVDVAANAPTDGLFSSLMNENQSTSVFDPQGEGVRNISVSEGGPKTQLQDDEAPPPVSSPAPQIPDPSISANDLSNNDSDAFNSDDDDFSFQNLDELSPINFETTEDDTNQTDATDQNNNTEQSQKSDSDKEQPKTHITKKKSSDEADQTTEPTKVSKKMATAKTSKKSVKKGLKKTDMNTTTLDSEKKVDKKEESQEKNPHNGSQQEGKEVAKVLTTEEPAIKKQPSFTPSTPEDLADSVLKAVGHSHGNSDNQDQDDQSHKKDDQSDKITPLFPHATTDNAGIIPQAQIEAPTPVHEAAPLSPLTKLSPEVYTLFEQMAGVITIESHADRDTTSVIVNMPGSVFDGSEIVFNKYKTAQNAYNLELKGSSQAVDMFNENLPLLDAAFKQGGFNFEVNILPPSLTQKGSSRRVKRKSGDNKKGKR